MRRIQRQPLDAAEQRFLTKRQNLVNAGQPVQPAWKSARQTLTMGRVFKVLCAMVGARERCFYCHDSRGTDIEHYRPKSDYPQHAFAWANMLLMCTGCNRAKLDAFPVDAAGGPLLIDPTAEDPWDSLFLEPVTGMLVARVDSVTGAENPRGRTTCDPGNLAINVEAVTEGRTRAARRLARVVTLFLQASADPANRANALAQLIQDVVDSDSSGVAVWFFHRDGQNSAPFSQLRDTDNLAWNDVQNIVPH